MILLELFWRFFLIGAFTFGGGYAMIPLLEREVVEKHSWATEEELMDYYAVSQCTPGVIAVNVATFIGFKIGGNLGGVVATLGVVTPSLLIIMLIASILTNFVKTYREPDYNVAERGLSLLDEIWFQRRV